MPILIKLKIKSSVFRYSSRSDVITYLEPGLSEFHILIGHQSGVRGKEEWLSNTLTHCGASHKISFSSYKSTRDLSQAHCLTSCFSKHSMWGQTNTVWSGGPRQHAHAAATSVRTRQPQSLTGGSKGPTNVNTSKCIIRLVVFLTGIITLGADSTLCVFCAPQLAQSLRQRKFNAWLVAQSSSKAGLSMGGLSRLVCLQACAKIALQLRVHLQSAIWEAQCIKTWHTFLGMLFILGNLTMTAGFSVHSKRKNWKKILIFKFNSGFWKWSHNGCLGSLAGKQCEEDN